MNYHKITFKKVMWLVKTQLFYKPLFKHIGKSTYLANPCYISGRKMILIGARVRIYPDYRIEVFSGILSIGNNVSIGNNLHIACGNKITIEDDVTISSNVFISDVNHDFSILEGSVMDNDLIFLPTIIGSGSFLGHNVTVLPGTALGKHCVVGANTLLKGSYPDYSMIVGCPGKIIKHYDLEKRAWINENYL